MWRAVFAITVDRYCSVRLPARYRKWRTDNKIIVMVIAAWVVPALLFFPTILGWDLFMPSLGATGLEGKRLCIVGFAYNHWFNIVLTVSYFWITQIVMLGSCTELHCNLYSTELFVCVAHPPTRFRYMIIAH